MTAKKGPKPGHKRSAEFKRKSALSKLGEKNPNWGGDSITVNSGRLRAVRMYPVIGPCTRCGDGKSERHHKDANTRNNSPENIEILCRRCHMKADGRLEKFKELGDVVRGRALDISHENAKARTAAKTHCKHGHELTPDNLRIYNGSKVCCLCARLASRHSARKNREYSPARWTK